MLEVLRDESLSPRDLRNQLGISKSTAHRSAHALADRGMLQKSDGKHSLTEFASLSFIVVFGVTNFLAIQKRESLDHNPYVSVVGLVGSLGFLPLMLFYLYTNEHAVFNAVVMLAVAVVGVELVYF